MTVSVGQVMRSINNFFESGYRAASYQISGGKILPAGFLAPGMYIAITGSIFHEGVWKIGEDLALSGLPAGTPNEKFYGRVWFLRPPADFLSICAHIEEFAKNTPVDGLQSESFGEYSQARAAGRNGGVLTWQDAFADDLRPYCRMFSEVM